jgi:hypothetical protein
MMPKQASQFKIAGTKDRSVPAFPRGLPEGVPCEESNLRSLFDDYQRYRLRGSSRATLKGEVAHLERCPPETRATQVDQTLNSRRREQMRTESKEIVI